MMSTPSVVVCFPYNGEIIAPFMVEYLYDVVDMFVMTEALYTFSGRKKDSYSYLGATDQFKRKDKINIVCIEKFQDGSDPWDREYAQRDAFLQIVRDNFGHRPDTVVYLCDADEVPNKVVFENIKNGAIKVPKDEPMYLDMSVFYYNFNWEIKMEWKLAYVAKLSAFDKYPPSVWRRHAARYIITNAGWHCSYFMSIDGISKKLASFSHTECDTPEFNNHQHIADHIREGLDLFNRKQHPIQKTPLEDVVNLPKFWLQLQLLLCDSQKLPS